MEQMYIFKTNKKVSIKAGAPYNIVLEQKHYKIIGSF